MMTATQIENGDEMELGEPPYISSPYPENIVQVREGETPGQRDVIELIKKHWFVDFNELERLSEEEYPDRGGYSGSFMRNILRFFFAPEDILENVDAVNEVEGTDEEGEFTIPDAPGGEIPDRIENAETTEEEVWHKLFRMGIRAALETDVDEETVFQAFGSGFEEGLKLREEMGR